MSVLIDNNNPQAVALELCGQILYGENWEVPMAKDLKLSRARRIRQFLNGEIDVPVGIWDELKERLILKQHAISQTINSVSEIQKLKPICATK